METHPDAEEMWRAELTGKSKPGNSEHTGIRSEPGSFEEPPIKGAVTVTVRAFPIAPLHLSALRAL